MKKTFLAILIATASIFSSCKKEEIKIYKPIDPIFIQESENLKIAESKCGTCKKQIIKLYSPGGWVYKTILTNFITGNDTTLYLENYIGYNTIYCLGVSW